MRLARLLAKISLAATVLLVIAATLQSASATTAPRVQADSTSLRDPVARLQARLDAGDITLVHDSVLGYLPAVLRAFNIPTSSQSLVFSRTSLRTDLIAPWSPRALYFNDDVYVGWVQGSEFLEIAAVHPTTGAVFYTMSQDATARPQFGRESTTCMMCHKSRATGGVPGFLMLSTIADRLGYQIASVYSGTTTDETPIKDRFGGWYVTGTHGKAGHSGNVYSSKDFHQVDKELYRGQIDLTVESARTDLAGKFDSSPYLSPNSDIVALMVLVHQTSVHNLITATHEAARIALIMHYTPSDATALVPLAVSDAGLHTAVERLVRALLFADEAKFDSPIHGTASFSTDFTQRGPRDKHGRSLRDFDLDQRLFKYPLSFLIYTEGFDALPNVAKDGVYRRLRAILSGDDKSRAFERLSDSDRRAILEILTATKPDFAAGDPHPQRSSDGRQH